jgi:outer membrane protein
MKKSILSLLSAAIMAMAAITAHAQPAPKVLVVDMQQLFLTHYKYQEEKTKLDGYSQKAQATVDQMLKDRNAVAEQLKEIIDEGRNPAASADAKAKAQADADAKNNELQSKTNDLQQFASEAQRTIQAQGQQFHDMLMTEITQKATEIGKRKGATLLLDKSGRTVSGALAVIFADPAYDITDDVAAEIAKEKPPTIPTAAPDASPAITVPNVTPGSGQ